MTTFSTKQLGPEPDLLAPDGAQGLGGRRDAAVAR